ncbi:MAG: hypothetical protein ACR2PL_23280 [Dehalococcoidia bacterium]
MANYLLVYTGGGMPATDELRQASMAAWGQWFGNLGQAVVDGGNPCGASSLVSSNGSVSNGAPSGITGYSVLKADSLSAAADLAKGCPILRDGGKVEVYETFNAM